MIKVPRSQSTNIKNIIYPQNQKMNPKIHKNNLESIKKKQEENKQKKDFDENHIPGKIY